MVAIEAELAAMRGGSGADWRSRRRGRRRSPSSLSESSGSLNDDSSSWDFRDCQHPYHHRHRRGRRRRNRRSCLTRSLSRGGGRNQNKMSVLLQCILPVGLRFFIRVGSEREREREREREIERERERKGERKRLKFWGGNWSIEFRVVWDQGRVLATFRGCATEKFFSSDKFSFDSS